MADVIAGRFALAEPIASGSSGVVWRATDLRTGRECAAKVLRRRDSGDVLRFVREQSVRVRGAHVLAPYSWAAEDEHVVIASKLARGGTLAGLLGDYGPLSEGSVAELLDQVLIALTHVHGAGLVHRDVKPANVLLDATGTGPVNAMLGDFGLALGAGTPRLTMLGTVIGTPGYLAPEARTDATSPGPAQDLYAAGALAVALLTGAEPVEGRPIEVSGVADPVLRELITDLSHPDPARRPPAAAARQRLAGSLRDRSLRTRDGDPVDVPDHIAHLLDSSGPDGHAAQPQIAPVAPTAPNGPDRPQTGTLALPVDSPARRRRTGPRRALPYAAAVVGVAAIGTGAAALLGQPGSSGGPGPTQHSTTAPGRDSGSSTAPATVTAARAGDPCSWQQEGDRATANDGRTLICTATAGGYVWHAA